MPVLYHGTSRAFTTAMASTPGTIDVTRGRGEFGRGFYTQDLLYGNNAALLVLTIDDQAYHALHFLRLSLNQAQMLNTRLRSSRSQHTYTTIHDLIVGPLVQQPRIEQQKFQTANAQTLLNNSLTQRAVKS